MLVALLLVRYHLLCSVEELRSRLVSLVATVDFIILVTITAASFALFALSVLLCAVAVASWRVLVIIVVVLHNEIIAMQKHY